MERFQLRNNIYTLNQIDICSDLLFILCAISLIGIHKYTHIESKDTPPHTHIYKQHTHTHTHTHTSLVMQINVFYRRSTVILLRCFICWDIYKQYWKVLSCTLSLSFLIISFCWIGRFHHSFVFLLSFSFFFCLFYFYSFLMA